MKIVATSIFILYTSISLLAQNDKLKITHLTGDFYIYNTYKLFNGNPFPANGMYLITDEGAVMFDTPWDSTQFQPLLDSIKFKHNKDVVMCLATHSHEDRAGGFEFFKIKGIKTYTTQRTDEIIKARNETRAEFLIQKDTTFTLGQHVFQTYYGGEGHTSDNIVIWFKKERILYGGCLVKSAHAADLGYVGEANLKAWPTTIKNIKRKFYNPAYIIPGHQDWRSKNSLEHTLDLLGER